MVPQRGQTWREWELPFAPPVLDGVAFIEFAVDDAAKTELADFLGETKPFLDLVIDQSPTGQLEVVPGEVTYSGKGFAGLRAIARAHPTENILYWQTLSSRGPRAPEPLAAPPGFERYFAGDVPY